MFFIISAYTLVFMNYYKEILDFNSFWRAFSNLLLIVVGIFDFNKIETDVFGLVLLGIFIFLIGFFLMNLITATYVDWYRITYLDNGYKPYPSKIIINFL